MTVFVAYFSSDLAADNAPRFDALVEHDGPITLLPQQAEQTRTLMRRMLNEQSRKSTEYEFSIKLSLERILLELYRAFCAQEEAASFRSPDSSKRVAAVLDYIAEHPYEQHTLSDAARIASLSQRQFRNICNELKGCGFSEYLNRLRIEHAEELLRDTNMSVTAIAFQVGYEDLSTFYRAFKKTHEIPPGRFREEMENN
jgi:AraC-like DNA-binding protein